MIPQQLRPFFWDVDVETFRPEAHSEYTISRILELGNSDAVAWMRTHFRDEAIIDVIRRDRRLSPRSANYWALIYRIPTDDVAALR